MFERFQEGAIKVMLYAAEEARHRRYNSVGTEMVLLALISEHTGIAAHGLESAGISYKKGAIEVEKLIGWGRDSVAEEIPWTSRVKTVVRLACDEADMLQSKNIDTEHILLGLINEANKSIKANNQGGACRVLLQLDIDLDVLRAKVIELIRTEK